MKTGRQRAWLTAMAVAGSVALYGCGGGSDGPDTTPFDQDYVDQKVDEAKKAEEERQAAIATAREAAQAASNAADAAKGAAKDAEDAAAAATIAATYETLDADEAEAQSTAAANAKAAADTALAAADAALAKANAVDHTDQAVTDLKTAAQSSASAADLSAKAAAGFATEAKTQADIARATQTGIDNDRLAAQEQGVQRRLAANKAGDAAEEADTAAEKATEAEEEAADALPAAQAALAAAQQALTDNNDDSQTAQLTEAVTKAQAAVTAATTRDADYNTRATTAVAAAAAAEAARDAAKMASEEAAAAALAAGDTDPESEGAKSAAEAEASYLAARISANVARGWSDVVAITKTYKDTDATEASLDDLLARIPWATDQDRAAGALSVLLARAHDAAEGLAEQEDPDSGGTKAYQEDIRRDLTAVTTDATNIATALSAARDAHNAAKPWSENGRAVDDLTGAAGETLATGAILINSDGRITLGGNAKDDPDTPENERLNVVADVTSPPSDWGPHDVKLDLGIASFSGNYHLSQYNRWGTGPGEVYDYISFGRWASSSQEFTSRGSGDNGGVFALVRNGTPVTKADVIGTASFTGNQVTHIFRPFNPGNNLSNEGRVEAKVNFAKKTADVDIYYAALSGGPFYIVREIKVDGNVLSGGTFSSRFGDDFIIVLDGETTTTNLHAAIFGEKAEEVVGTIRIFGYDDNTPEPRLNILTTAFGARNNEYR